jgi:hypothetical protein
MTAGITNKPHYHSKISIRAIRIDALGDPEASATAEPRSNPT